MKLLNCLKYEKCHNSAIMSIWILKLSLLVRKSFAYFQNFISFSFLLDIHFFGDQEPRRID